MTEVSDLVEVLDDDEKPLGIGASDANMSWETQVSYTFSSAHLLPCDIVLTIVGGFIIFAILQETTHSWLRLEDDDDSSIDLLASSNAISSDSAKKPDTSDGGKVPLGDVFTGHKQVDFFLLHQRL